jgi:hypothetical protein
LYFAGYLTTLAYLAMRLLMLQLELLFYIGCWCVVKLLAVMFMPFSILLSSWQDGWDNTQGNKLHMVKPSVQAWNSSFIAIQEGGNHTHASGSVICTCHMATCCVVSQHLFVLTVVSRLLWHTSWLNAHIVAKSTLHIIFMAPYPSYLVMIAITFLMFWNA